MMRLLLVVPLVIAAALLPAQTSAAPQAVVVKAPARVAAGSTVTFSGAVLPHRRTALVLQRHVGKHWTRTGSGHTARNGRFRISTVAVAGRARYRVVASSGRHSRPVLVTGVSSAKPPPKPPVKPPAKPVVPAGAPRSITDLTPGSAFGGFDPSASDDGRWLVFVTKDQLVSEDTNVVTDVYLRDTSTGATTLVSRRPGGLSTIPSAAGGSGADVSPDGAWVVFESEAAGLASAPAGSKAGSHVFLWARRTGKIQQVTAMTAYDAEVAEAGNFVVFVSTDAYDAGDTNGVSDVVRWDRTTGTTTLVSVCPNGKAGKALSERPSMSDDGRRVAFHSLASDLVQGDTNGFADVFLWTSGEVVQRISAGPEGEPGSGHSLQPAISGDGTAIAYASLADNVVPDLVSGGQALVLRWTEATGNRIVSTGLGGTVPSAQSHDPTISTDGRRVSFLSSAANLTPVVTGGSDAAYVWDAATGDVQLASRVPGGEAANEMTVDARLVGDGTHLLLSSLAINLVAADAVDGAQHLFLVTMGPPAD